MFSSGLCSNDNECDYTHFCWPANPNNSTTECLELFSQDIGKRFGVIYNTDKTLLENSLEAGKFCKSGIAAINANRTSA